MSNEDVSYSDMHDNWADQKYERFEVINLIIYILLDIGALVIFAVFIAHIILTMRYPEHRLYTGDKEYIKICDPASTGMSLSFKVLLGYSRGLHTIPCKPKQFS